MDILCNIALFCIPGTAITEFGKAGEAVEVAEDVTKGGKVAEAAKDIPKFEKGVTTLEDAQKAAKAAEAEKAAKVAKDTFLLKDSKEAINLAKASQGNPVYTGIDKWLPAHLNKGEIYYRGEPKGTEFFTTKDSISSVGASRNKLFKGLQVREDPVHGYRKEMQGYMLNTDLNAAQAKCLANSQFGKGGLEQKYIPNANELIEQGILIPVDRIGLK